MAGASAVGAAAAELAAAPPADAWTCPRVPMGPGRRAWRCRFWAQTVCRWAWWPCTPAWRPRCTKVLTSQHLPGYSDAFAMVRREGERALSGHHRPRHGQQAARLSRKHPNLLAVRAAQGERGIIQGARTFAVCRCWATRRRWSARRGFLLSKVDLDDVQAEQRLWAWGLGLGHAAGAGAGAVLWHQVLKR